MEAVRISRGEVDPGPVMRKVHAEAEKLAGDAFTRAYNEQSDDDKLNNVYDWAKPGRPFHSKISERAIELLSEQAKPVTEKEETGKKDGE